MRDYRLRTDDGQAVITPEMLTQAKESLILRRDTHLDQLIDKLQEPRVQRAIGPILEGVNFEETLKPDDVQYVIDLGLVSRTKQGLQIANPIYQEVIPRELSYLVQLNLESHYQPAWYISADGSLDMEKFLESFQQLFREHSESWVERFSYKEAGPQLLLQAFLQRIINSGGQIIREYGLGRQRTDLLLLWPYDGRMQRAVIELKIQHRSLEHTLQTGLEKTGAYMDKSGTADGHLIIFNRDPAVAWSEKGFRREETQGDYQIVVWGM